MVSDECQIGSGGPSEVEVAAWPDCSNVCAKQLDVMLSMTRMEGIPSKARVERPLHPLPRGGAVAAVGGPDV